MSGIKNNTIKTDFYQTLLHWAFKPLIRGKLTVKLPEGNELIYGNGQNGVHATIIVKNRDFFKRCVLFGDIGFAESFIDGDWETEDVTKVLEWMILNVENHPTLMSDTQRPAPVNFFKMVNQVYHAFRDNNILGSRTNIGDHYDLGNSFFRVFLDPSMTYSSAYFEDPQMTLEQAQYAKYDALCKKARVKNTDHVLEIGSGWGGFALFAAQKYGCRVTTITISTEQFNMVQKRIKEHGLSHLVDVQFKDYRLMEGQFDKIVSIEMIEAVGHKYLETYFRQCHRLLKKDGLLALQMILSPDHRYDNFRKNVDFIQKHIFPGSLLPSMKVIAQSIQKTGNLNLFDYEDITPHYVRTLIEWRENFNKHIDQIRALGFDDKFIRKWNYYWCYCEAGFKMHNIFVAQAVFSRPNNYQLIFQADYEI